MSPRTYFVVVIMYENLYSNNAVMIISYKIKLNYRFKLRNTSMNLYKCLLIICLIQIITFSMIFLILVNIKFFYPNLLNFLLIIILDFKKFRKGI